MSKTETIAISLTVGAKQSNTCSESIPFDGFIKFVRVSFPNSKNTVGIRLIIDSKQVLPSRGDLLIDNGVVEVPINMRVSEGSQLVLFVGNGDSIAAHTVVATVGVEPTPEEESQVMYAPSQAVIEGIPPEGIEYQQQIIKPGPIEQMMPGNGPNGFPQSPPLTFISEPTPIEQLPPPLGMQRIPAPSVMRQPVFPPTFTSYTNQLQPQIQPYQIQRQPMDEKTYTILLLLVVFVMLIIVMYISLNHNKRCNEKN